MCLRGSDKISVEDDEEEVLVVFEGVNNVGYSSFFLIRTVGNLDVEVGNLEPALDK